MVETARERMTAWDWRVLGQNEADYKRGKLLTRRLDIPLPETIDGLYELSHKLAFISQELARVARLGTDAPSAIGHASQLLMITRLQLKEVQRTWETELRERQKAQPESAENIEQLRSAG